MITISKKYLFKVAETNNQQSLSIIEDPFGFRHTLPVALSDETVELIFITKKGTKCYFSQENCAKTGYSYNEVLSLPILNAEPFDETDFKVTFQDCNGREFTIKVHKMIYDRIKDIGLIKLRVLSILGERIHFRIAEDFLDNYQENKSYELEVIEFKSSERYEKIYYSCSLYGFTGEIINVSVREWQYNHKEEYKKLFVKLITNKIGSKIFQQDYSFVIHPLFEHGKEYDFILKNIENAENGWAIVTGLDNCDYSSYLPFFKKSDTFSEGDIIKYVYLGLRSDGHLRLKCFVQFEEIIRNYRALKRLTFDSIYKENSESPLINKFRNDYDSFQNLWIISFCEILRERIKDCNITQDFDSALIYIDVLVQAETWILESGFLSTFSDLTKIETQRTAKSEIEKFTQQAKALEIILDNKQPIFLDSLILSIKSNKLNDLNDTIKLFVQVFWNSQAHIEDNFEKIISLLTTLDISTDFYHKEISTSESIISLLEKFKSTLEKRLLSRVFISSKERNAFYCGSSDLKILIQVNLLLAKLFQCLNRYTDLHLAMCKVFKLYSFYVSDHQDQLRFLTISMGALRSTSDEFLNYSNIEVKWEYISQFEFLIRDYGTINNSNKSLQHLPTLNDSLNEKSILIGNIIGKSDIGYLIDFNQDILILPYYTTDRLYTINEQIEFIVNRIDSNFSTVFVLENRKLIGENIIRSFDEIKVGDTVRGRISEIEDKHVRVNLGLIDAIMFINDVSTQFISHPSAIFKIGQIIDSKIIEIEEKPNLKICRLSRKALLLENIQSGKRLKGREIVGTITNIHSKYGLSIELEYGESCYLPIKYISWNVIYDLQEVFDIGDKITVKIINYNTDGDLQVSALLASRNPLTNISNVNRKNYKAKIFAVYNFDYWAKKLGVPASEIEDNDIFYCPKCYINSQYKIKKNLDKLTDQLSLYLNRKTGRWHCENCQWKGENLVMLWLPELNCTAAYTLSQLNTIDRNNLISKIIHGDTCDIKIESIGYYNKFVYVDIIPNSFIHTPRVIQSTEYNKQVLEEIASNYEHYSFLTTDYKERINYLNFSRYFYGAARNYKSYYLKAYVDFTNILDSFENVDLDNNIVPILDNISELIAQIEKEDLSVEIFPIIETIIKALKILRLYKTENKDDLYFLLKNATDTTNNIFSTNELAKVILSLNLIIDEETVLKQILNRKLVNLLRESLTLFESQEIDEEEYKKQSLIYKLMSRGENSDSEFKSSLDVPVLSKNQKKEISKFQQVLNECINAGDTLLITKTEKQLALLKKVEVNNKIIIKEINLGVIKTLAAFTNTNGGYLVIGIDEDENDQPILAGLQPDYSRHKNKDSLKLRFDSLIQEYLGDSFNQYIEKFEFINLRDKEVLLIKVSPSLFEPVFVKKAEGSSFFIRRQASTVSLSAEEQYKYCISRFKQLKTPEGQKTIQSMV